ncbi:hypothetical protein [Serratia marcescens]|nr:hypothetical protein [Serratia marcescens]
MNGKPSILCSPTEGGVMKHTLTALLFAELDGIYRRIDKPL